MRRCLTCYEERDVVDIVKDGMCGDCVDGGVRYSRKAQLAYIDAVRAGASRREAADAARGGGG